MKIININSGINEQKRLEAEEIYTLEQGVTEALIEKYKPRVPCDIENLSKKKFKSRVA